MANPFKDSKLSNDEQIIITYGLSLCTVLGALGETIDDEEKKKDLQESRAIMLDYVCEQNVSAIMLEGLIMFGYMMELSRQFTDNSVLLQSINVGVDTILALLKNITEE